MITEEDINKAAEKYVNNTTSTADFKAGVKWALQQLSAVTRFEVIDHTTKAKEKSIQGRVFTNYRCDIELSLQDNNKTLKVFVKDKN